MTAHKEKTEEKRETGMPAEHARELAIVAMLLTAAIFSAWIGETHLASSLGGAAVALVLPSRSTMQRVAIVGGSVALAAGLSGCGGAPVPARAACRAAAATLQLVCEHVPETMGGESQ